MSAEESSIEVNSLGNFDSFDEIDLDYCFQEQRSGCVSKCYDIYDTKHHIETFASLTSEFVSEEKLASRDAPSPDRPPLGRQGGSTRQRGTRRSYNVLNTKGISNKSQVLRQHPSIAAVRAKSQMRTIARVCSRTASQNSLSRGLETAV